MPTRRIRYPCSICTKTVGPKGGTGGRWVGWWGRWSFYIHRPQTPPASRPCFSFCLTDRPTELSNESQLKRLPADGRTNTDVHAGC